VYRLTSSGTKQHVLSSSQLAPGNAVVTVDAGMLAAVTRAVDLVSAGMLIKKASSPMVYVFDGAGGAIPVSSFATTADIGLGSSFATATDATIDALTIAARPLTNAFICGEIPSPFIGVQGTWMSIDTMGSIPHLAFSNQLCSAVFMSPGFAWGPVLLRSANSPAVYQLIGGEKHWILNGAALLRVTGGNSAPTIWQPNDAFLSAIPTGAPIS
jgi:hypothetical protein